MAHIRTSSWQNEIWICRVNLTWDSANNECQKMSRCNPGLNELITTGKFCEKCDGTNINCQSVVLAASETPSLAPTGAPATAPLSSAFDSLWANTQALHTALIHSLNVQQRLFSLLPERSVFKTYVQGYLCTSASESSDFMALYKSVFNI